MCLHRNTSTPIWRQSTTTQVMLKLRFAAGLHRGSDVSKDARAATFKIRHSTRVAPKKKMERDWDTHFGLVATACVPSPRDWAVLTRTHVLQNAVISFAPLLLHPRRSSLTKLADFPKDRSVIHVSCRATLTLRQREIRAVVRNLKSLNSFTRTSGTVVFPRTHRTIRSSSKTHPTKT